MTSEPAAATPQRLEPAGSAGTFRRGPSDKAAPALLVTARGPAQEATAPMHAEPTRAGANSIRSRASLAAQAAREGGHRRAGGDSPCHGVRRN